MYNRMKLTSLIIVSLILLTPINRGSAGGWSDNFDTAAGWDLQSYKRIEGIFQPSNHTPSIINGQLQMPNTPDDGNVSAAVRNSTVAYGSWNFDWYVTPGIDHSSLDVVFFISNVPVNLTGWQDGDPRVSAYFLTLKSWDRGSETQSDHSIALNEFDKGVNWMKGLKVFPSPIDGSHHIEVTRDLNGKFNVSFDSEPIIIVTDNTTKTSETFWIGSWCGDSAFDNITVDDTPIYIPPTNESTTTTTTITTTTTTVPVAGSFPSLFSISLLLTALAMINRRRKKH